MNEVGENSTFLEGLNATSTPHYINNWDNIFSANRLSYIAELVEHYYTPLLCLLGSIGNCLSVAVFCFNANQRNLSSSYYLSALAISDTGFLITVFVFWLETFGPGVLSSKFGCPIIMYLGQVTCFLSVWLTVERFFAVCSPLKRSSICTVSKAKKVIFGLATFALIAFSYALLIARVEDTANIRSDDYLHQHQNVNDNSTTRTSVIEQSFTSGESLIPLQPNHRQSILHSLKMNRVGCLDTEDGCQRQLLNGIRADGNDSFSMDGHDAATGRGGMALFPLEHGDDNDEDSTFPDISFMTMFNSTMLVNLNESDSSYEAKDEGIAHNPELRCTVPLKYITVSIVANYLDSVITLIIPFCLITYFNMRIALCVWRLKDERKRIVAGTTSHKFSQIPASRQAPGAKGYFARITRGRRPQDVEVQELQPINRFQYKQDRWACQMCGGHVPGPSSGGDSSNLNIIELTNANHANAERISQPNEVSCSGCKSLLSQPTLNESVSVTPFPASQEDATVVPGKTNLTSDCAEHCFSSTSPSLIPKLFSASDLNHKGAQSLPNSGSKGMIPNAEITNERVNSRVIRNLRATTASPSSNTETRVTKMLLLVSTVFVILNLPSHAIRLLVFLQSVFWGDDIEVMRRLYAAQQLSNVLLFNTNFAVNFLLYCLSGRNFRKSLSNVLFGRCHKKSRRSPKSYANTTLQKTVHFVPNRNSPVEAREIIEQTAFPKSGNEIQDIANDFESIELETTMA